MESLIPLFLDNHQDIQIKLGRPVPDTLALPHVPRMGESIQVEPGLVLTVRVVTHHVGTGHVHLWVDLA